MKENHLNPGDIPADTCPDFDALSRFVDGELRALNMEEVRDHLANCTPCTQLAKRLNGRPDWLVSQASVERPVSGCAPADEMLLYVSASEQMRAAERRAFEAHLHRCDPCLTEVSRLHHRLGVAQSVEVSVPAPVRERARVVLEPALRELAAESGSAQASSAEGLWGVLRRRLKAFLELPILVPTAMAAGALFMVVLQETRMQPGQNFERSRAVSVQQRVRVTAASASVRAKPNPQANEIATLSKGAFVAVTEEDRNWVRVDLSEGRTGWVERRAFE
jgi:anti-sigma factor RsiW